MIKVRGDCDDCCYCRYHFLEFVDDAIDQEK